MPPPAEELIPRLFLGPALRAQPDDDRSGPGDGHRGESGARDDRSGHGDEEEDRSGTSGHGGGGSEEESEGA